MTVRSDLLASSSSGTIASTRMQQKHSANFLESEPIVEPLVAIGYWHTNNQLEQDYRSKDRGHGRP